RDRDAGRELKPRGMLRGDEQREERIAIDLRRHDPVEAERLDAPDGVRNAREVVVGKASLDRQRACHADGPSTATALQAGTDSIASGQVARFVRAAFGFAGRRGNMCIRRVSQATGLVRSTVALALLATATVIGSAAARPKPTVAQKCAVA